MFKNCIIHVLNHNLSLQIILENAKTGFVIISKTVNIMAVATKIKSYLPPQAGIVIYLFSQTEHIFNHGTIKLINYPHL